MKHLQFSRAEQCSLLIYTLSTLQCVSRHENNDNQCSKARERMNFIRRHNVIRKEGGIGG